MMTETYKNIYKELPIEVKKILNLTEGWLIGGSLRDSTKIKDYDIIITKPENLQKLFLGIHPTDLSINSFGGFKFKYHDIEFNVWIDSVDNVIARTKYALNLKQGVLIENI